MKLLLAAEVADLLRVKKSRVYELVRQRAIPVLNLGERQYRFDEGALCEWIAAGGSIQSTATKEVQA